MFGSIMGTTVLSALEDISRVQFALPSPNRRGTPLDYRVKPNRWPNGHTQARQAGRLLTKPGTIQRRWNMLDYYSRAAWGYDGSGGIPYRNR